MDRMVARADLNRTKRLEPQDYGILFGHKTELA